jgi:hypothetical protein
MISTFCFANDHPRWDRLPRVYQIRKFHGGRTGEDS